jgi:hypothetical protein
MSKEKKLSKKQAALYGQELGKIGRAAERGKAVNKAQEKMNDLSQKQMIYNKLKNQPIRQKLEGVGLTLAVTAATNPNLGRNFQTMFTGNPVQNVRDALLRQRMIQQNFNSAKPGLDWLEKQNAAAKVNPTKNPHMLEALNKSYSKENVYRRAVQTANEDMALIQTNRIINKAVDKQVAEAVKKLQR